MARKKILKGVALKVFKVGDIYQVGDEFQTTDKKMYSHLINTKRIK
jgi:hypothetical protein